MKLQSKIEDLYRAFLKKLSTNRGLKLFAYLFEPETYRNPKMQRGLMFVAIVTLTSLILVPRTLVPAVRYNVGDIATKDFKASKDYIIIDKEATDKKQKEATNKVLSVYDLDKAALTSTFERVNLAFEFMHDISNTAREDSLDTLYKENRSAFSDILGVIIPDEVFNELVRQNFSQNFDYSIKILMDNLKDFYIVESYDTIASEIDRKGIILIDSLTNEEKIVISKDNIVEIGVAKDIISKNADKLTSRIPKRIVIASSEIAKLLVKPNVTFDLTETEKRKDIARKNVVPVTIEVKKGEKIIEDGQRLGKREIMMLEGIVAESQKDYNIFLAYIGILVIVALLIFSSYTFASKNIKKFKLKNKDILFLVILILTPIFLIKFYLSVSDVMSNALAFIPESSYKYAMPIAAGAMLVRIVLNSEIAIFYIIIISIFSGVIMGGDNLFAIYIFIGALFGAHLVAQTKQRSTIVNAGLIVGAVNVLVILFSYISRLNVFSMDIIRIIGENPKNLVLDVTFGFLGGIFSSVVVLGVAPLVELIFGYTTDIKLVELSNLEHPLLRDMVIRAPGTYHHSIVVGNLVESAATAIGANPLLSRVSAYYHDIGKLKKPNYFIENIKDRNPHDNLTPHMSSLILMSHVKDGVEMARRYGLGAEIIDIIKQHHGTHIINFFYQKAKEANDSKKNPVNEKDFRYPGPKPQTREAAIVQLADNVEAASKVLTEPTPSRIETMVQTIIERLFLDGQLDQCDLTLKDLDAIGRSFIQVLNGIFHQRVDYPEPVIDESIKEEKIERDFGDSPPHKRTPQDKDKKKENHEKDAKAARPLGKGWK